jgi:shikimate dehydrogenase
MMTSLAERLHVHYPALRISAGLRDPAGRDLVVNATSLGTNAGDPLPLDVERIAPSSLVGDVVMMDAVTPFLAAARERGCQTQTGLDMLFEQIPIYLEFFGFPTTTPDELRKLSALR